MPYQFAIQDADYTDFSSGRVLYSLPGMPAFPVRLASEIFQRARAALPLDPGSRLTLYDTTCGGAYHLTALGLLHGDAIDAILASDVDPRAVELARRNLGLLSPEGLLQREQELRALLDQFGKTSHAEALHSAASLRKRLDHRAGIGAAPIRTRAFQANALDPATLKSALAGETIHLVISDVPYGRLSAWQPPEDKPLAGQDPIWHLLDALLPLLAKNAVVAIAADKAQKAAHPGFHRVDRFQVGRRRVTLLSPA